MDYPRLLGLVQAGVLQTARIVSQTLPLEKASEVLDAMEPDGDFSRRHLLNPVLLRMLADVRGQRILDAGCGHGYLSRMLAAGGAMKGAGAART